jgi:hypothetical protein
VFQDGVTSFIPRVRMPRYENHDGNSGVESYEIGMDFITVRFRNGSTYRYDRSSPGAEHVHRMKELALAGRGLSTYISQHVREAYARKES